MLTEKIIQTLLKTKLNKRWKEANGNKIAFTESLWSAENVLLQFTQAVMQIQEKEQTEQELRAILSDDIKLEVDGMEDILDDIEIKMRSAFAEHNNQLALQNEQLIERVTLLERELGVAGLHKPKTSVVEIELMQTQLVNASPTHLDLADAAARFLQWHMDRDGYVSWFRHSFSKGQLMNESECWDILTNSVLQLLSFVDFEEVGILPSEMMGKLLSGELDIKNNMIQGEVEFNLPDGSVIRKTYKKEYIPAGPEEVWAQTLYSRVSYRHPYYSPACSEIPYYKERGISKGLTSVSTSVISEASSTANVLSDAYRIDFWDAIRFLLTGIPPSLKPISAREIRYKPTRTTYSSDDEDIMVDLELFNSAGPISLTFQPWLMPEEVADYWRGIRSKAARKRKMPSEEYLAIFRFVLDNTPDRRPRWTLLAKQWGDIQGNECNSDTLRKVFNVVRAALFPSYEEG